MFLSAVFLSCSHKHYQTITTSFGHKMLIVREKEVGRDPGDKLVRVDIDVEGTDYGNTFLVWDVEFERDDMTLHLKELYSDGNVSFYLFYEQVVVAVANEGIIDFGIHFPVSTFYNTIPVDKVYNSMKTACETKNFELIKIFSTTLSNYDDSVTESIIRPWSTGNVSNDILELNESYTKEEIVLWSKNFIQEIKTGNDSMS